MPLLTRWLQALHVRVFWDDGERDETAVAAHYFAPGRKVAGFIFLVQQRPAGYLQTVRVTADSDFWPFVAPDGETWGLDLLIGERELTGRGLGPRIIAEFTGWLRRERPELRRVLIDPAQSNERALRAYAKAGFREVGRLDRLVLMALELY